MREAASTPGHIRYVESANVAWVTIDNAAAANALSMDMIAELDRCWTRAGESETVRAVVLTGAGHRHFCAGVDRQVLSGRLPVAQPGQRHNRTALTEGLPKPVVTVVCGAAVGLGMNLALDADLIVASEDAFFYEPRIAYRLLPNAPIVLARESTYGEMARVGLLGERLTAQRAHEIGLVARVTMTAREAHAVAASYAASIAQSDAATMAESVRLLRAMRRDDHWHAVMADVDRVTEVAELRRSADNERRLTGLISGGELR